VSTTATPDGLTSLPDEQALAATVVALEDPGDSIAGFFICPSVASMVDE
jgi:hypothetical protein